MSNAIEDMLNFRITGLQSEIAKIIKQRDEARAEIERLRDLFRIDGEQHANHINSLTKAHVGRITKYADEIERLRREVQEARAALEAAEELYLQASPDAWKNGVTAPSGTSDEGEYLAARAYDQIRAAIAKLKDRAP